MDISKKVEARSAGPQSSGPALCQEGWDDGWFVGAWRQQSATDRGSFPLPADGMDVDRREDSISITSNTELNRK